MKVLKYAVGAVALAVGMAGAASAQDHTLRIQTHFSPESLNGKNAQQFADNVEVMSGGRLKIEMFYSSSVVKSTETFDAAVNGVLDGDMTGGAYQTGKNPAFQFVGDIMGGYDTPWQQYAWLYYGGGIRCRLSRPVQPVQHAAHRLVGLRVRRSHVVIGAAWRARADLVDWKFRSPPGLETEIFAELGASPIVMDFTEIFTALETGIIDGADASGLATNNVGLGLYDLVKPCHLSGLPLHAVGPSGDQQGGLGRAA